MRKFTRASKLGGILAVFIAIVSFKVTICKNNN